jgi:hypothetical protein
MQNEQYTLNNHFIADLCSVDSTFPMKLWDKPLPHATITLNLLLKSRINPRVSAYAQLNGNFDFNRTPLPPPLVLESSPIRNKIKGSPGMLMGLTVTT